jgi:hypothetical protein
MCGSLASYKWCVCIHGQLQQCSKHGWTENTNISSQSKSLFCTALMTQLHNWNLLFSSDLIIYSGKAVVWTCIKNRLHSRWWFLVFKDVVNQQTIANNFETSYWNMMGMQTRQYQRHNILVKWHVKSTKIFTSHVVVQHQRVRELVKKKNCWICTVTYQMVQSSVLCKQNRSSNITFLWDMMACTSVKRNHAT